MMVLEGAVSQPVSSICPTNDYACSDCFYKGVKYGDPGLQGRCELCTQQAVRGSECIACLNLDNAKYPIANVYACLQCVAVAQSKEYGCSQYCLNATRQKPKTAQYSGVGGLSAGAIAGIVIGVLALLALVVAAVLYLMSQHRKAAVAKASSRYTQPNIGGTPAPTRPDPTISGMTWNYSVRYTAPPANAA
ncbi:hypothetical protein FOA52_016266 [Chlamydomonas sp. UWO 241]|nr:hypothetical protein FOA52_016266 [Chlamydomonas sp. UWO 241]